MPISITAGVRMLGRAQADGSITIMHLGAVSWHEGTDGKIAHQKLIIQSDRCNTCCSGRTFKWLLSFPIVVWLSGNCTQTFSAVEWKAFLASYDEVEEVDP